MGRDRQGRGGTAERARAAHRRGEGGRPAQRARRYTPVPRGGNGEGGGQPPNGALPQTPPVTSLRESDTDRAGTTRTVVVQPRRPGAAVVARPAAANGGTPTRTAYCVVNDNTCLADRRGGVRYPVGGRPGGGTASQSGRRPRRPRGGEDPGTAGGWWRTPPRCTAIGLCL